MFLQLPQQIVLQKWYCQWLCLVECLLANPFLNARILYKILLKYRDSWLLEVVQLQHQQAVNLIVSFWFQYFQLQGLRFQHR